MEPHAPLVTYTAQQNQNFIVIAQTKLFAIPFGAEKKKKFETTSELRANKNQILFFLFYFHTLTFYLCK